MERIVSVVRKILQANTLVSEELNKIDKCLYETVLFVIRKTSRFIENQEASKLLSNLGIRKYSNKNRESIQTFKETSDLKYIYNSELDKACFAHDAAFLDSKDFAKITISGKILKDETYVIVLKILKMVDIKED